MEGTFEKEVEVTNPHPYEIEVWFEPWGQPRSLPPNEKFRILASSPQTGELEIVEEDGVIAVYGWSECSMRVYKGQELVDDFFSLPALGNGPTPREFVRLVFGGPGGPDRR